MIDLKTRAVVTFVWDPSCCHPKISKRECSTWSCPCLDLIAQGRDPSLVSYLSISSVQTVWDHLQSHQSTLYKSLWKKTGIVVFANISLLYNFFSPVKPICWHLVLQIMNDNIVCSRYAFSLNDKLAEFDASVSLSLFSSAFVSRMLTRQHKPTFSTRCHSTHTHKQTEMHSCTASLSLIPFVVWSLFGNLSSEFFLNAFYDLSALFKLSMWQNHAATLKWLLTALNHRLKCMIWRDRTKAKREKNPQNLSVAGVILNGREGHKMKKTGCLNSCSTKQTFVYFCVIFFGIFFFHISILVLNGLLKWWILWLNCYYSYWRAQISIVCLWVKAWGCEVLGWKCHDALQRDFPVVQTYRHTVLLE